MIGVVGAGAFGTALAVSMAKSRDVILWARDAEHVREMQAARENKRRLPGVRFPENLTVTARIESAFEADTFLLALPTQSLRGFFDEQGRDVGNGSIVACCKGIELGTGLRPTQIIVEHQPSNTVAMLTGPSFATDIARGMPTALTLACEDLVAGEALQRGLFAPNIRLYRTADVTGAELGGALKNVVAIACGAAMGAGLGESARAALMTRGFAEMVRVAEALGGRADTLAGLSGFGDLALTCTSDQSRNYRYGQSLGEGVEFDPKITVEGAATARALTKLEAKAGLELPITNVVTRLVSGELKVAEAMDMLLSRPLKEE